MAVTSISAFGRTTSNTANADTLVIGNDAPNTIQFTSDTTGDGLGDGDLILDGGDGDPVTQDFDPNTLVDVGDGNGFQQFEFLFFGTLPVGNNKVPVALEGEQVFVIVTASGDRYWSLVDATLATELNMDAFGNGNLRLDDDGTLPPVAICFTFGTLIGTPSGEAPIEELKVGDLVTTVEGKACPIRWIGRRSVPAFGKYAPVEIAAGAHGNRRRLVVSQQHRMLTSSAQAELLFGESEVLVRARDLIDGTSVRISLAGGTVGYFHLLFDDHEIIFAEGAPTESFHPGQMGLSALDDAAGCEVLDLFPELGGDDCARRLSRRELRSYEARALAAM